MVDVFCFQAKMDLSSYTPEQMEKAKHRGRVYQCVACHFQKGERWVDEIGKLQDHILWTHIPPERIPFFCQLCKFKCLRQEQLIRHVTHYARHVSMAAGRGIIDLGPYLCRSQNPYQVTEMDYFKLSQEASLKYFLEKSAPTGRASSVDASITMLVNGTLESDITQETLRAGFINLGAHQPEAASVQANGPAPVTAFRPVMLASVQPNQWRQHSRYDISPACLDHSRLNQSLCRRPSQCQQCHR